MEVVFLKSFSKDLDRLKETKIKVRLKEIIKTSQSIKSINDLSGVKKLAGFKNAYRLRVGYYRLGVFVENEKLIFARFVHRKDIYKVFP